MKKIVALLTALGVISFSFVGHAQTAVGKANGTVTAGQKTIEAASVGLLKAKDSSVVKRTVTDKAGLFGMDNIADGKYLIVIQSVGFAKYYTEGFAIGAGATNYTVKAVSLRTDAKDLDAVTVVS